jgi:hypothetical protein
VPRCWTRWLPTPTSPTWLYGDAEAIESVAADPEVVAHSGPFKAVGGAELVLAGETVPLSVTALDSPDIEVNRPPMRAGRWVESSREVVLDRSAGAELGIDVGVTSWCGIVGATRRSAWWARPSALSTASTHSAIPLEPG